MSKQLSAEMQSRIKDDAEVYGQDAGDRLYNIKEYYTHADHEAGYEAGATKYALELTEAQERIKHLEDCISRIANGAQPSNDNEAWSWIQTARQLANEALTPNNQNKEDE